MGRHRQPDVHHPSTTGFAAGADPGIQGAPEIRYEPFGGRDSADGYRIESQLEFAYGDALETDRSSDDGFSSRPDPAGRHRADSYLPPEPIEDLAAHYVLGSGTPRRADVLDPGEPLELPATQNGFEPEPLFASLASSFPEEVRLPEQAHYPEPPVEDEPTLHFSGPRFEPLPGAPREYEPIPAPQNWAYDAPVEIDAEPKSGFDPVTDPDRRHNLINPGRHRAEPSALGRHRGERTGGVAHSMSGRAVFATAIATALTAGGVGAAATLPTDHSNSSASHHTVHSIAARTVAESITAKAPVASSSASDMGTRLAIDVATPAKGSSQAARGIKAPASAGKKTAAKSSKASKTGRAKPAKKAKRAKSKKAATGGAAPPATPAAKTYAAKTTEVRAVKIALPKWVRPGTGYISSGYEPRWGTFHYGIDLAAPYGSPIYAAGDGVVLRTGPATGFGEAIYIQHANGDTTVYGHEETTLVSPGEHVHAGQLIARVGAEGEATGPHLHFEVHQGSEYGPRINPGPWLAARGVTL